MSPRRAQATTVTGLTKDTEYDFRISGYGNGTTYAAEWGDTAEDDAETLREPIAPSNFSATALDKTRVRLTWRSLSGITKYRVERKLSTSNTWTTVSSNVSSSSTSYTVTGLTKDTEYDFRISGYGNGTTYTAEWGDTAEDDAETLREPIAPSNFSATALDKTRVQLTWRSLSGITKYRVERKLSTSNTWTTVSSNVSSSSTSYTVTGLTKDTEYDFRISGYGNGTTYTAEWGDTAEDDAETLREPIAPSNFSATALDKTRVRLTWRSLSGITKYRVERKLSTSNTWTTVSSNVSSSSTSYTVTGLTKDTEYDFRISGYGNGTTYTAEWGDTAEDDAETLREPIAPSNFSATALDKTRVRLTWRSLSGITKYRVERKLSTSNTWTTVSSNVSSSSTSYTVTGLTKDTEYDFRISGYGNGTTYTAEWGDTAEDDAETLREPIAPSNFSATALDKTRVRLTWRSLSGITKYRVGRKLSTSNTWTTVSSNVSSSSTSYTVTGLECDTEYDFRISGYGNGTTYTAEWGAEAEDDAETASCDITLTGSASSVKVGRTVDLTVSASGLSSSVDYTVVLSRPSSNSDIGFDSDCSDASKTLVPPTRGSSFDLNATLYTCDESGGTVTAQLRASGSNVSGVSDTHRVNVSIPTISFSGATAVENGDDASVTVQVGNLDSTLTYTVEVTASSRIALNSACDDRTDSYGFSPSSSSWSRSITVLGCSVGEADLSVEVSLSGPGTVASESHDMTVTDPQVELTGSASSVKVGRTVEFTVAASGLDPNVDYSVLLSRLDSNTDIGFDSDCSDASKTLVPPTRGSSFDLDATLYTCDSLGGTVTAQLRADGSDVSGVSDTHQVTVSVPTILFTGVTTVALGEKADIDVTVDDLDSTLTYAVEVTASSTIAFDDMCSDREDSHSVSPTGSSWSQSVEVYGCSAGSAGLRVEVSLQDPGVVVSRSFNITVVANRSPEFGESVYRFDVDENAAIDDEVGVVSAMDMDVGDPVSYYITGGTGRGNFSIEATGTDSGKIKVAGTLDYEVTSSYTLEVEASDGKGGTDEATVSIEVNNVDEPGVVTLDTPSSEVDVGTTITATLVDPDGGVRNPSWQWQVTLPDSSWGNIVGANLPEYTPSTAIVGKMLRATVAYTDAQGPNKSADSLSVTARMPQLAKPTGPSLNGGIDVVPVAGEKIKIAGEDRYVPARKIKLTWHSVPHATRYIVEYRPIGKASSGVVPYPVDAPDTSHEFRFDQIFDHKSFAPYPYYALEFRVKAVDHISALPYPDSDYSETVVVIDTPILKADGDSRGSSLGKASLEWREVPSPAVLGIDNIEIPQLGFDGGTYSLRYRKYRGDHRAPGWLPGTVGFETDDTTPPNSINGLEYELRDLEMGEIYAIQLRYMTGSQRVYAARDVYVWPSTGPPLLNGNPVRVGSYPLKAADLGTNYAYHICEEVFPDNTPLNRDWIPFIKDALGQWQLATKGLVTTMAHDPGECAKYEDYVDDLEGYIRLNYSAAPPIEHIKGVIRGYLQTLANTTTIRPMDYSQNEIKMVNVGRLSSLAAVGVFPQLSRDVGLSSCLFDVNVAACAVSQRHPKRGTETRDIVLNQSKNSIGSNPPSLPKVRFNKCIPESPAYGILVHEAGHVLGIRPIDDLPSDTPEEQFYRDAHPFAGPVRDFRTDSTDTVMSYSTAGLRCSPHPFDIMAMYALYQTTR